MRECGRTGITFLCALVLASIEVAWSAGCASRQRGLGDSASPTGGIELTVDSREVSQSRVVYYTLEPDGTLGFAGGVDAMNANVTWRGAMDADSLAALRAEIVRGEWLGSGPRADGTPKDRIAQISIKDGRESRRYKLIGRCEAVERLEKILDAASRERLEPYLQRLPRAGEKG